MSIRIYNNIAKSGLSLLKRNYKIGVGNEATDPLGILLRSHNLNQETIPDSVLGIARCGIGVNNIPVDEMTTTGTVVFNTPGSNANSVKELTLTGMLLASRNIVQGINYVNGFGENIDMKEIEANKKLFQGTELMGKTIGLVGLGNIGRIVAESCQNLGMNVIGYDPISSVSGVEKYSNIQEMVGGCDFLSIHVPYIEGETNNLLNEDTLANLNSECHILNFARNGIVDEDYLIDRMNNETFNGYYITDFPNNNFSGNLQVIQIPHLGASTNEASENSTLMAVNQLDQFLLDGTIKNSVNFPEVDLEITPDSNVRLSIINHNTPGVISDIAKLLRQDNINIIQQINKSSGDIAYNLFDLDCDKESDILKKINNRIENTDNILRTRIIYLS